jgi:hypothetical protein
MDIHCYSRNSGYPKKSMESYGTHLYLSIAMDVLKYAWISMDIHGSPLISMDVRNIHSYQGMSMDIHEYLCIMNGYPWNVLSIGIYGISMSTGMDIHG